jgi:hypothetical protein
MRASLSGARCRDLALSIPYFFGSPVIVGLTMFGVPANCRTPHIPFRSGHGEAMMSAATREVDKSALEAEVLEALHAYQEALSRAEAAFEAYQNARSSAEQQGRVVLESKTALEVAKQELVQCRVKVFTVTDKLGYMPGCDDSQSKHIGSPASFS